MEARSGDRRSSDNRKRRYGDRRSREKPPHREAPAKCAGTLRGLRAGRSPLRKAKPNSKAARLKSRGSGYKIKTAAKAKRLPRDDHKIRATVTAREVRACRYFGAGVVAISSGAGATSEIGLAVSAGVVAESVITASLSGVPFSAMSAWNGDCGGMAMPCGAGLDSKSENGEPESWAGVEAVLSITANLSFPFRVT